MTVIVVEGSVHTRGKNYFFDFTCDNRDIKHLLDRRPRSQLDSSGRASCAVLERIAQRSSLDEARLQWVRLARNARGAKPTTARLKKLLH